MCGTREMRKTLVCDRHASTYLVPCVCSCAEAGSRLRREPRKQVSRIAIRLSLAVVSLTRSFRCAARRVATARALRSDEVVTLCDRLMPNFNFSPQMKRIHHALGLPSRSGFRRHRTGSAFVLGLSATKQKLFGVN